MAVWGLSRNPRGLRSHFNNNLRVNHSRRVIGSKTVPTSRGCTAISNPLQVLYMLLYSQIFTQKKSYSNVLKRSSIFNTCLTRGVSEFKGMNSFHLSW